jgi:DNA-binding NarL/FixJ family response regulator
VLRIVIAEDHPILREAVREALDGPEMQVVGEAGGGRELLAMLPAKKADVVLLDLQLPDTTGFAVAQEIAGDTAVVITSTHEDDDFGAMARRSGARGFLSKSDLSGAAIEQLLP